MTSTLLILFSVQNFRDLLVSRLILVCDVQISGTISVAFLSAPDIFGSFPGHGIFGPKYDSC